MKTISINVPSGKTAEWINGVLTLVDENTVDQRTIQERVQSYEDALAVLGEDAFPFDKVDMTKDEIAYIKLKTIVRALNENWEPKMKSNEYLYYPWYYLYSKSDIDKTDQTEKDERRLLEFCDISSGCTANYDTIRGFGFANAYDIPSSANMYISLRLSLKNEELAIYCGKQFIELWFEFLFPGRSISKVHNL